MNLRGAEGTLGTADLFLTSREVDGIIFAACPLCLEVDGVRARGKFEVNTAASSADGAVIVTTEDPDTLFFFFVPKKFYCPRCGLCLKDGEAEASGMGFEHWPDGAL